MKPKLREEPGDRRLALGALEKASNLSVAEKISRITKWAEIQARTILENGPPLSDDEFQLALRLGVQYPEEVLVLTVDVLPLPKEASLRQAVEELQLITASSTFFAIGYNIFLRGTASNERVSARELLQVVQCEQLESIPQFFRKHLLEMGKHVNANVPIERAAPNVTSTSLVRASHLP